MEKALCSSFAMATALLAGQVAAQTAGQATAPQPGATTSAAPDPAQAPGDIIVTAQKRAERLMSVPISITALSAEALNRTGSKNLIELQSVIPGLYVSGNTGYSVTPIAIRGVSGTGNALGDEPVAVYVDGVFQNAQTVSTNDFLDIAGLEVVRGPQGTLQGRNSTAGALLIRTQDPSNVFGGYLRASISTPTEYRVQGAITGPLSDTLTARLAVGAVDELGWANNTFTGTRAGGQNSTSIRSILLWRPGTVRFRLSAGYTKTSSSVAIQRFAQTIVNPVGQAVILGVNATPKTPLTSAQLNSIFDDNNIALNVIPRADVKTPYGTLEATIGLGGIDLVSITGYVHLKIDGQSDSDGLALTDRQGYNLNHQTLSTLSQEVRLQSSGTGPFSWIVGGYATHIIGTQDIALYNLSFSTGRDQYLHSIAHQINDALAPFADATFKFTEQLSVTGGVRYTHETKDFRRTSGFYNLANVLYPAPPFSAYNPPKAVFNDTSYRAKLAYTPSHDALFYASYSKGFKSGGFNALGNDPAFAPETLTSAEVGAKLGLFDRRLSLTASAYHNDYDNLQVTAGVPAGGVAIYNAAKAKIDGGELEAHARLSDALTFDANVAYTKAHYTSFPNAQGVLGNIVNATGNTLARAPRWQFYLAPTFAFKIGSDWTAQAQASYRWRSRIFFFATDQDATTLQSGSLGEMGARLGVTRPALGLTLAIVATNLTNERAVTNEQSLFNYPVASFNKPRSVGLQIEKSF